MMIQQMVGFYLIVFTSRQYEMKVTLKSRERM
jgi:hypothetical protein